MDYTNILTKQVEMLSEWNKSNINTEPEQVRLNALTILTLSRYLISFDRKIR